MVHFLHHPAVLGHNGTGTGTQTGSGLCALDSEISCRKLFFIRKLFSSPNLVIKRLAKLNL